MSRVHRPRFLEKGWCDSGLCSVHLVRYEAAYKEIEAALADVSGTTRVLNTRTILSYVPQEMPTAGLGWSQTRVLERKGMAGQYHDIGPPKTLRMAAGIRPVPHRTNHS